MRVHRAVLAENLCVCVCVCERERERERERAVKAEIFIQ
jgi:hypothetical protein